MVAVDLGERLVAHRAEAERQEAGRVDLAVVRDEDDALAVAGGGGVGGGALDALAEQLDEPAGQLGVERGGRHLAAGAPGVHHAAEERRLDGAHDEAVVRGVEEEVADVLVLLRA